MRLRDKQFYRQVGVRTRDQFTRPRLVSQTKLNLPLESLYHYRVDDGLTLGPPPNDPLWSDTGTRVFVEHVTELTSREGNPRRTAKNPALLTREYRRKNRGMRPLGQDRALTINPRFLLVVNYALLPQLYRYITSMWSRYYRWVNIANTVWGKVEELNQRFGRNQFLELPLPDVLPTTQDFMMASRRLTSASLKVFSSSAALDLLDFYKWLGDDRASSTMAAMSDETLYGVNFIFRVKDRFFVLNLGKLNEWRRDVDDEDDQDGLDGSILQRRFVRLLHGIRDWKAGTTQVEAPTKGNRDDSTKDAPTETPSAPDAPAPSSDASNTAPSSPAVTPPSGGLSLISDDDEFDLPEPITVEQPSLVVEPDQNEADDDDPESPRLPQVAGADLTSLNNGYQPPSHAPDAGIEARARMYLENGVISPRAAEKAIRDGETYKTLPDPFGSGETFETAMKFSEDELKIPETPAFQDRNTYLDKSMRECNLEAMKRGYTSRHLNKDVMQSVLGIQQLGIAVKDYKVETVENAMDHYQIHTVTLKPVRGKQSTVRFRLPVVDEQGRFTSNGTQYSMRLQRADVPIRKVSPTRVALTSYYNKVFVDRSPRTVNDFGRWLTNEVVNRGLDPDDTRITQLRLSNTFNQKLVLPRIYTLMAQRVISLQAGDYRLVFDHSRYNDEFPDAVRERLSNDEQVLVGWYGKAPMVVDYNDVFHYEQDGELVVLGTLPDLLELDVGRAPIEIAEMSVANKTFPVGFVLAYHLGLSQLLELLQCEVSRFPRGQRYQVQPDEYTLVFDDEVLVLSRLERQSAYILAGLNRYHRVIKQYSVWDFDRRDVFYKLLEDGGLGVRYLREIDMLFSGWMDHITRGLLEDMGEPTDMVRLLFRSVELLQTDHAPEEVNGAYQRYRGYERFSGMVYSELMRVGKAYNARIATGDNSVEMNPHTVWQNIIGDATVAPVEDRNPIRNLREQEVITYRGAGGRGAKSLVGRTRIYHKEDMGVVSESTVDSGDVGVIAYLSPNANFTSLRGTTRRYDSEKDGTASLLSTSALNAPALDKDDPKRINISPFGR